MRFLVDECTGPSVARWLRAQSHDVFSVYDEARGMTDDRILEKAASENRVLITNDTDFGEKVYRERRRHRGIILLRLEDNRSTTTIRVLENLLERFENEFIDAFVVASESAVRFGPR